MKNLLQGARILVVDDELDIREIIMEELELTGALVYESCSGNEALKFLESKEVDLVLSDAHMPQGSGFDLLKGLKNKNPNFPEFMFISGQTSFSEIEAYDAGATDLFVKPIDFEALFRRMKELLKKPHERLSDTSTEFATAYNLECKFDSLSQAKQSKSLNLGRCGFYFQIKTDLPPQNSLLSFNFIFSSICPLSELQGVGKVRWLRPSTKNDCAPGIGVEMLSLSNADSFCKYIESQNTKAFIPKN